MSKSELLNKTDYKFEDLVELVELLRAPDGCPWDREQTHASIRKGLIEETYEVVEGIDKDDADIMCEELGDLLLQVVFHASIADSDGRFDMDRVCDGICKKLIYRHPHVFSDVVAETSEKVLINWDALKQKEKGQKKMSDVLDGVSSALPSLMRAQKLSKKAEETVDGRESCEKISRLVSEIGDGECSEDVFGRLLFECARLANIKKIDLEQALYNENERFCDKKRKNS